MDELGEELRNFAMTTNVSKGFLLNVIARVRDNTQQGSKRALDKAIKIKQLLHCGMANQGQPPLPPVTHRVTLSSTAIDANTQLGMVNIGGTTSPLTVSMLFTMVSDLQAKVDILNKHSKSTKVIFDCKAFALKTDFILWFTSRSPAGERVATWVNIISIWTFGTANHIDTTQWLMELYRSKSVSLKGSMDVPYVHLISTCYPPLFVGMAKDQILSTTTIKMFDSHNARR
jgi:hypothetical protein